LRWPRWKAFAEERLFDLRHGVSTRGVLYHAEGSVPAHERARHYEGARSRDVRRAIALADVDPAATTFVDLGCGKGKALVLAVHAGFRRVVGVELSRPLADAARSNLARHRCGTRQEVACTVHALDATRFVLPDEPCLVFLYNPFAEPVMRKVLDAIAASVHEHPRPVVLLYLNPVLREVLDAEPWLRRRATTEGLVVYDTVTTRSRRAVA
jgi:SAM-dependent methyltransferase